MARNVEIKARIDSVETLLPRAAALSREGPTEIHQDDAFFRCETGRMKLRRFPDGAGELIFYQRANQQGPKASFYVRTPTADPDGLREALTQGYGLVGRVQKHRTLFLAGRTRIHLDRVADLGHFLELEVVLSDGDTIEDGIAEAQELMSKLGVTVDQLIEGAYLDLLAANQS
jgi:predicted adenylyl cyclase CyaB